MKRTWFGINFSDDITMWKPEPSSIKLGEGEDWFRGEWAREMTVGYDGWHHTTPTPDKIFLIHWETKDIEEIIG